MSEFEQQFFDALVLVSFVAAGVVFVVLFFVPRWRSYGVGVVLLMHVGFLLVVGRRPFGHFTEDILIALIAFLSWPRMTTTPTIPRSAGRPASRGSSTGRPRGL